MLLIGSWLLGLEVQKSILVVKSVESQVEHKPITIEKYRNECLGTFNNSDPEPSKFISKPKNNFKKR